MDITALADAAQKLGVISLLLLALIGGVKKWYVFGWQYDELKAERDELWKLVQTDKAIVEKTTSMAERLAELTVQVIQARELASKN